MRAPLAAVVAVFLATAGCVSSGMKTTADMPIEGQAPPRPIVIALLDSGTNPYLDIFRSSDIDTSFTTALPLVLSEGGTISERMDRDDGLWSTLIPGTLYHFAGTRLLAISFDHDRSFPYTRDADQHGSATSYLAAREAPSAIIIAVQVNSDLCTTDPTCLSDPSVAEGMTWIAAQDWIDVVSISLGMPGNIPDDPEVHPEARIFIEATRRAAAAGKVIVNAAGNEPTPPLGEYHAGPPWVCTVGGVNFETSTSPLRAAAAGMDVSANYTDLAPRYLTGELEPRSGTSFSTPIVAGTLANALSLIGRHDDRARTAHDLRLSLNASALTVGRAQIPNAPVPDASSASLPILVQPQQGWGYVNASLAPEIARRVIEQDFTIPAEKDQSMLFQPAWQQAREEYWAKMRSR